MTESSSQILDLARQVLEGCPAPLWVRTSPLLGRQALEQVLAEYWPRRGFPEIAETPLRCQLICLREYGPDRETARVAEHVWWALSRACHHHPYELGPAHGEISAWLDQVAQVIESLTRNGG